MASGRPSSLRQHIATGWLLANCAVIVFWPGSAMAWFPLLQIAMLLWPLAGLGLLFAAMMWPTVAPRRLLAVATVLAGAAVGWGCPHLGPMFHVWWRQDAYLAQARAALADPQAPPECRPGWVEVDHTNSPPVRAAFFWFAVRGDVDGVVYDPTGEVANGRQPWLYGARAWHLFGPWYQFAN